MGTGLTTYALIQIFNVSTAGPINSTMLELNASVPILYRRVNVQSPVKFWSTDDSFKFKKNSKNPQWPWHDRELDYRFNSWGYRTVEYADLGEDFILTLGCSNTEGIGICEEDRWSNRLASALGCELYCAGLYGQGSDTVARQSVLWSKRLRLPRAVYIQWPSVTRKTFASLSRPLKNRRAWQSLTSTPIHFTVESNWNTVDGVWFMKRYTAEEGEMVVNFWQNVELADLAWRSVGVPVIHFTWEPENMRYLDFCSVSMIDLHDYLTAEDYDFARDYYKGMGHQGTRFNHRVAETLYDLRSSLI